MTLPRFTYHPDPIGTGSVVASAATCRACQQARGYVYAGAPYAKEELEGAICPWCIADGTAAARFDAEFVDADGVGDYGGWDRVPESVVEEISKRTPGFMGWQQERWWTHCGDAAEYLGRAGRRELAARWSGAIDLLRVDSGYEGEEWEKYLAALDAEGSPTAYVFRCRHCGALGGYSDSH
ncbi:MAG: CbrC family protein [Gemmatimonadales bacterium]|nr:CbrC family protein [Gemmatimonadales bacterium]